MPEGMTDNGNGTYTVSDPELGETIIVSNVVSEGMVYRMYNPNSGEHVYTKDAGERDQMVSWGWNYEEDASYPTISADEPDAVPVYRLYNPYDGQHHWTVNAGERDYLASIGWNDEGIAWRVK